MAGPAGVAPTSLLLAAARALAHLIVYRCAGCTSCCSKPSGLRSQPRAVVPTNAEWIFVFGDRSDHVANGSPVEGTGEHRKRLLAVDVLKLIDKIMKLAFAVGKRDALDHASEEEFGS